MLENAQPKPDSRAARRIAHRKAIVAHRHAIYRQVSTRDGHRCRKCKAKGPGLHHHHLRFRSRGGADSTDNIFLACASCHADIHGYRMTVSGNANGILRFTR